MCPCGNGADRGWESKVKTLRPVKAAVWTICHLDGFFPLLVWRCPSFRCFEANLSRYCPSVWNTEWLTKMGTFFHIGWYNPLFGTFDGYVTLSNSFPFLHNFFWSIRVQNVPVLSGGVSCVFDDITETSGDVTARGHVTCMSPSLKDHSHTYGRTSFNHGFNLFHIKCTTCWGPCYTCLSSRCEQTQHRPVERLISVLSGAGVYPREREPGLHQD